VVIGDSLVRDLTDSILSPGQVMRMPEDEVKQLASEPEASAKARQKLREEISEVNEVICALLMAD